MTTEAHKIGPYSRPCVLAKLDGRTKEARLLHETRDALVAHVGSPSTVEAALIERATWLTLRCAQLDAKMAAGAAFTQHDSNQYLAWSNALARTLARLGLKAAAARVPTLAEITARIADRDQAA